MCLSVVQYNYTLMWRPRQGRKMENGERKMENGRWRMEDGEWRTEDGEWKMENGRWRMEDDAGHPREGRPGVDRIGRSKKVNQAGVKAMTGTGAMRACGSGACIRRSISRTLVLSLSKGRWPRNIALHSAGRHELERPRRCNACLDDGGTPLPAFLCPLAAHCSIRRNLVPCWKMERGKWKREEVRSHWMSIPNFEFPQSRILDSVS